MNYSDNPEVNALIRRSDRTFTVQAHNGHVHDQVTEDFARLELPNLYANHQSRHPFDCARITDWSEDGQPAISFQPWSDGHAVGFKVTRHGGWLVEDGDGVRTSENHATEDAAWTTAREQQDATNGDVRDVKHVGDAVSYVYLNPSTDTFDGDALSPDAFVYTGPHGNPALDSPHYYYNIEFEGDKPEFRIGPDEDAPPRGN